MVEEHVENIRKSGFLAEKRAKQDVQMMYDSIDQALKNDFYHNTLINDMISLTESDVKEKRVSAYIAAQNLLDTYFNILKKYLSKIYFILYRISGGNYADFHQCKPLRTFSHAEIPSAGGEGGAGG